MYWMSVQFSTGQPLSCVQLAVTPWTEAHQASLSITNSWSLLKLMSIKSVMPSNHLILHHPFSSCLQSFPESGYFPSVFASGDQNIGVSALALVLPVNIQEWFPLGLTTLISLQSKGLSRVFSNTTVQKNQSSVFSFLYGPTLTSIHDYWTIVWLDGLLLAMSLLFNMFSRLVIAFLPRSKRFLISWLQSQPEVTLEPKKIKV